MVFYYSIFITIIILNLIYVVEISSLLKTFVFDFWHLFTSIMTIWNKKKLKGRLVWQILNQEHFKTTTNFQWETLILFYRKTVLSMWWQTWSSLQISHRVLAQKILTLQMSNVIMTVTVKLWNPPTMDMVSFFYAISDSCVLCYFPCMFFF